jgi:hypothetical protein
LEKFLGSESLEPPFFSILWAPVVLVINVLFVIALQIDVGTMASLPQEIKLG